MSLESVFYQKSPKSVLNFGRISGYQDMHASGHVAMLRQIVFGPTTEFSTSSRYILRSKAINTHLPKISDMVCNPKCIQNQKTLDGFLGRIYRWSPASKSQKQSSSTTNLPTPCRIGSRSV